MYTLTGLTNEYIIPYTDDAIYRLFKMISFTQFSNSCRLLKESFFTRNNFNCFTSDWKRLFFDDKNRYHGMNDEQKQVERGISKISAHV